jgi:hypothetical protein
MAIKPIQLSVNLPFGLGGMTFIADEAQQKAAWALYVELVTRVAVQPLDENHGLLREALASLYSLFAITRTILRECGSEIANGPESLGPIAIEVLNKGLRPFLAEWHPRLESWEARRKEGTSKFDHEREWADFKEMRKALAATQAEMRIYADMLAKISGAKHVT